jgi:hypothetical protein
MTVTSLLFLDADGPRVAGWGWFAARANSEKPDLQPGPPKKIGRLLRSRTAAGEGASSSYRRTHVDREWVLSKRLRLRLSPLCVALVLVDRTDIDDRPGPRHFTCNWGSGFFFRWIGPLDWIWGYPTEKREERRDALGAWVLAVLVLVPQHTSPITKRLCTKQRTIQKKLSASDGKVRPAVTQ